MAEVVLHIQERLRIGCRGMQQRERLLSFDSALRDVHFPECEWARSRASSFDELYLLQLAVAWKASKGMFGRCVQRPTSLEAWSLGSQYGMWLTDAQELALDQIRRGLLAQSMQRLLREMWAQGREGCLFLCSLNLWRGLQVAYIYSDAAAAGAPMPR